MTDGSVTASYGRGETPLASPPVEGPTGASRGSARPAGDGVGSPAAGSFADAGQSFSAPAGDTGQFPAASFGDAGSGLASQRDTRFAISVDPGSGFSSRWDPVVSGRTDPGFSSPDAGLPNAGNVFPSPAGESAFSIPDAGDTFPAGSFGRTSFGGDPDSLAIPAADSFAFPAHDSDRPHYHPTGADTGSVPHGPTGESTESFTAIPARDHDPDSLRASESTETFPAVPPDEAGQASPG